LNQRHDEDQRCARRIEIERRQCAKYRWLMYLKGFLKALPFSLSSARREILSQSSTSI
jgi:hypothetical protein